MADGEKESWRFIVLLGKCGISFFSQGLLKSYSILVPVMATQFRSSYAIIGLIVSMQFTATFLFCPFAQMMIKRFGPRPTSLAGGTLAGTSISCLYFATTPIHIGVFLVLAGLGFGMLFQTGYVALKDHFGDQYGSMNTISIMGTVLGTAALPMLTKELYEAYGLHGTFLVLGALTCNLIAVGGTMRYRRVTARVQSCDADYMAVRSSEPEESTKKEDEASFDCNKSENFGNESIAQSSHRFLRSVMESLRLFLTELFAIHAIKEERFFATFFLTCQLLMEFVYIGWTIFLVSYGLSIGIDPTIAPYLTVASAAGGVIVRIFLTILQCLKPRWSPHTYVLLNGITTVALFLYPVSKSFEYTMCCSVVAGIGLHGSYACFYAAMGILVAPNNFPGILAMSFFETGLMSAGTGALAGYLYDVTESFETVYMIFGSMTSVIVVLGSTYLCIQGRKEGARE
ncbi:monocarboxylate transporter 3-like [Diadema setosum]|uniref:monocarboxylate transporter 3-like n=1 Tax=Diadema setosum TaxID=31175 RepID=UPI003B3A6C29